MENGETELEVGRKELTLDRPPSLNGSPISSPNNIKKELNLRDDSKETVKALTVNNDDLIEKLYNEFQVTSSSSPCPPADTGTSNYVSNDGNDKEEENQLVIVADLMNPSIEEEHYSNEPVLMESTPKFTNEVKRNTRYYRGKILTSCLKAPVPETSSNEIKVKRNVYFPEKDDIKEHVDPVDPWRDGIYILN